MILDNIENARRPRCLRWIKKNNQIEPQNKLVIFQSKEIRRLWHEDEWYYSVVDIIEALTASPTPRQYWGKLKQREFIEFQLSPIWVQLKLPAGDGKLRQTDCVNTKSAFRLIQSIPSKKAEPFKQWLAQVGKERLDENKSVAKRGGKVAGTARQEVKKEFGRSVISKKNYLSNDNKKRLNDK